MTGTINKLEELLKTGNQYLTTASETDLSKKASPKKWSKKEILGHLIDSGVNNLQRFTEIQFEKKPYKIRPYNQDGLVKYNDYHNSETNEINAFWLSINNRIIHLMKMQTNETLKYEIELKPESYSDLRFLMEDYVSHMEHHINQITNN